MEDMGKIKRIFYMRDTGISRATRVGNDSYVYREERGSDDRLL